MLYYEDIQLNQPQKFGQYEVTREEVIEFASKYDPQPFHLDDEAAAKTHFGRLAASGWHSAAMMMRMLVDHMKTHKQAGLGSPGADNIRWVKPVYPGDTLRCEQVTLDKRLSKSRPNMGIMKGRVTVFNQKDEIVMTMESTGLIQARGD
ncbi:MaoC family dehydratase [Parasphingorhabdus sp.]|uniref:MaoC family dehydratase n=1 Tax=Parasphingorhabdus sp. TaxID=2709688 RepID=UPI002F9356E9